jgi:hypothetical protein
MSEQKGGSRRRRTWSWIGAGFLFLALVLLSPFLAVHLPSVRNWMLDHGLGRNVLGPESRIRIARVRRLDPWAAQLEGLEIQRRRGSGEWETWAELRSLRLDWRVWDLVWGRYRLDVVDAEGLRVDLAAAGTRPAEPSGRDGGPPGVPDLRCRSLRLRDLRVLRGGETYLEAEAEVKDVRMDRRGLGARLERLAAVLHPALGVGTDTLSLRGRGGRLRWAPGKSARLEDLRLETRGLRGQVWLEGPGPEPGWHLGLEVARAEPEPLLGWLGLAVPEPWAAQVGDSLRGGINADLVADTLEVRLSLEGLWAGRPVRAAGTGLWTAGGLVVEALDLQRPDGTVRLSGAWDPAGGSLRLRGEVARLHLEGPDFPWGRLPGGGSDLSGRLELRVALDGPVRGRLEVRDVRGRWLGGTVSRLTGRLTWDPEGWRLDTLTARLQPGEVRGAAWGRGRRIGGRCRLRDLPLDRLARLLPGVTLSGLAEGGVTWEVAPEGGWLSGDLAAREAAWGTLGARRLRLEGFRLAWPQLQFAGEVEAWGWRAGGFVADSLRLGFFPQAEGTALQAWARLGRTTVTLAGRLEGIWPGRLELRELTLLPPAGGPWVAAQAAELSWSEGGVSVEGMELRKGSARAAVSGRLAADGALRAEARVEGRLSQILSSWGIDTGRSDGRVSLESTLGGTLAQPRLRVEAVSPSLLLASSWPVDSARVRIQWADSTLWVEAVEGRGPWGQLRMSGGLLRFPGELWETLRGLAREGPSGLARRPWAGRLELDRVNLVWVSRRLARVGTGIPASSRRRGGATDLESLIRIVRPQESRRGMPFAPVPAGLGSLRLSWGGTPHRPRLELEGRWRQAAYRWSRADSLFLRLEYADSLVRITELTWWGRDEQGEIRGNLPLSLSAWPPRLALARGGPGWDLQVEIPRGDLALLSPLSPLLQEPRGFFHASLRLRGPATSPVMEGEMEISEGSLRVPLREERLRDLRARLRMDAQGVHVLSAEARIGQRGRVRARGRVRTLEDMDLQLELRRAPFFETGVYQVVADADLRLVSQADPASGEIRPHVLGDVTVREATILNLEPRQGMGPPRPDPWIVRLNVEAPSDVVVSQPNARLFLGNGSFRIVRRDQVLRVAGTVEVQSGWYRVFNRPFTVREGRLEFRDTGQGWDLVVDMVADTKVTGVLTAAGEPVDVVEVTARLQGSPEELNVSLESRPPLSREEIIELLSIGWLAQRAPGTGSATVQTGEFLLSEVITRLEGELAQEMPWLRRVRVEPGAGEDPYRLVIQAVSGPQFSINYAQQLSYSPTQEVTLHYRLSDILFLKAGLLREPLQESGTSEEYNLDLKFRIEYE